MTTINGGEAVYRVLKANGIDTVFGLLGDSMLELYDAMYQGGGINHVGARDERAAGHMADAWARMTGKPGVVLGAQAGPGVVNIVTAVAEAQLAYSPLVVIAGAITRADQCKDTFQEIDQVALFAPISKRSVMVTDPSRLAPMLEDAIRLANTGRRGPVVLHVSRDLFAAEVPGRDPAAVNIARPGPAALSDISAISAMLADAKRPVIFAGGGFKWGAGREALTKLAELLEVRLSPQPAMRMSCSMDIHGSPAKLVHEVTGSLAVSRKKRTSWLCWAQGWALTRPSTQTTMSGLKHALRTWTSRGLPSGVTSPPRSQRRATRV